MIKELIKKVWALIKWPTASNVGIYPAGMLIKPLNILSLDGYELRKIEKDLVCKEIKCDLCGQLLQVIVEDARFIKSRAWFILCPVCFINY